MKSLLKFIPLAVVSVSLLSCNNVGDETGYFTDTLTIVNESSHQVDMSGILFYKSESNPSSGYWYAESISLSPADSEDGSNSWSYCNEERMVIQEHSFYRMKPEYVTITIDGQYTADLTKSDTSLAINPCVAENWSGSQTEEKDNNYFGYYTLTITEEAVQNAIDSFSAISEEE